MTDEERTMGLVGQLLADDVDLDEHDIADIDATLEAVRVDERRAIVAWLRTKCQPRLADLLERGEHRS